MQPRLRPGILLEDTSLTAELCFPAESRAGRGQGSSGAIRGAECVFYARGHCKFGNDCKFIHLESSRVSTGPNNRARGTTASPDNRTSNGSNEEDADALLMSELAAALPKTAVPCKFFAEGLCTRDNCRFSHATDGGKTVEDCPICLQRVVSPKMFGLLCTPVFGLLFPILESPFASFFKRHS